MTNTISEFLTEFAAKAVKSGRLAAMLLVAMVASVMPAHAQSGDVWKSIAIIGGSTAAGAIVGNKVGGKTGAYVGAAVGATAGYAIDKKRRDNNRYDQYGYENGYYGDDRGGYYGNNGGYRNDGYYGNNGSYNNGSYNDGYYSSDATYRRSGNDYPYGSDQDCRDNNRRGSRRR